MAVGISEENLSIDLATAASLYVHNPLPDYQDQPVDICVPVECESPSYDKHSCTTAESCVASYISNLGCGVSTVSCRRACGATWACNGGLVRHRLRQLVKLSGGRPV